MTSISVRDIENVSPALRLRLGLDKCPEFDTRKFHVEFYFDRNSGRYVRTSLAVSQYPGEAPFNPEHPLYRSYHTDQKAQAASNWREKYGVEISAEGDIDVSWAETLMADATSYEGPTQLTESELAVINRASEFGDFTLDMLWLIVECLGWRPGQPVSENDPGWISVWAEEEEVGGYLNIVRAVLGMPEVPYGWKPLPVIGLEASQPAAAQDTQS